MTDSYLWDLLEKVKREDLPARLRSSNPAFQSLFVDYEPPFVERLWFQLDARHRVFLHRIEPCNPNEALWHPHPWPSIVDVLDPGECYEHAVAFENEEWSRDSEGNPGIQVAALQRIRGPFTYLMDNPKAWHRVSPTGRPSWSIMITGPVFDEFDRSSFVEKPSKKLDPLPPDRFHTLIRDWSKILKISRPERP